MSEQEIYERLNEVFRNVFDDDDITVDASSDRYHKNVETMTMNAINYLMNK